MITREQPGAWQLDRRYRWRPDPRSERGAGILLTGPDGNSNRIGGVNPGEGNLISANLGDGVSIVGRSAAIQ